MKTYIIKVGVNQNIFDICNQEYGTVQAIFILMEDNPTVGFDTVLSVGQALVIRESPEADYIDTALMDFIRKRGFTMANGDL